MSATSYKLTYFDIQGVAESVRLAFQLQHIPFEDNRITFQQWPELKKTAKFGQLPLLEIDNKDVMSQSHAMLRYIGRLNNSKLYPVNDMEKFLKIEEVIGLALDFEKAWTPCIYASMKPELYGHSADFSKTDEGKATVKSLREAFMTERLPVFLQYYADFIKNSGGPFMCGSDITIADLVILPQLNRFQAGFVDHVPKDSLDKYPEIIAYLAAVRNVPEIKEWYESH